jgi:hypothetical protein
MSLPSASPKLRFVIGMLQIAGVGFSLGIIVTQGLTTLAVGAGMLRSRRRTKLTCWR